MARLSAKGRAALPKTSFGMPGARKCPMPDKTDAVAAKRRATQAVKAGRMSPSTEHTIDAKANRVMGKGMGHPRQQTHPVKSDRGDFKIMG